MPDSLRFNQKEASPRAKTLKQHYKVSKNGFSCFVADVTLTFRPLKEKGKPRYFMPFRQGMICLIQWLQNQGFEDYIFYPEYGSNHKLHFHGTVYYRNKLHFCSGINSWRYEHGHVVTKGIKNDTELLRWHLYCRKDTADQEYFYISKYNQNDHFGEVYSYIKSDL